MLLTFFESLVFASSIAAWLWLLTEWRSGRSILPFQPRRLVAWQGVDVLLVLATYILAVEVSMAVAMRWTGTSAPAAGAADPQFEYVALASSLAASVATLAGGIGILRLRWGTTLADLGFDTSHFDRDLKAGAVAFAATAPCVYAVQAVLTRWIPYTHPLISAAKGHAVFVAISGMLVAPVFEEFFFRGLLQGWLERVEAVMTSRRQNLQSESALSAVGILGTPLGSVPVIISAALFALMHLGQGPAPIALFVFALVLGFLYRQTHRLWPSITVHFLLNAVTLVVLFLGGEG